MQVTTQTQMVTRDGQREEQITTTYTFGPEDHEQRRRQHIFYKQFDNKPAHNRWLRQPDSLIQILQEPWKSQWPVWIRELKASSRRYQKQAKQRILEQNENQT
jgi:hypothetical protein